MLLRELKEENRYMITLPILMIIVSFMAMIIAVAQGEYDKAMWCFNAMVWAGLYLMK